MAKNNELLFPSSSYLPYPQKCGYIEPISEQPGISFNNTIWQSTNEYLLNNTSYLQQIYTNSQKENLAGYPMSSYEPVANITNFPPNYKLCITEKMVKKPNILS